MYLSACAKSRWGLFFLMIFVTLDLDPSNSTAGEPVLDLDSDARTATSGKGDIAI